jgi:hypothetical protein
MSKIDKQVLTQTFSNQPWIVWACTFGLWRSSGLLFGLLSIICYTHYSYFHCDQFWSTDNIVQMFRWAGIYIALTLCLIILSGSWLTNKLVLTCQQLQGDQKNLISKTANLSVFILSFLFALLITYLLLALAPKLTVTELIPYIFGEGYLLFLMFLMVGVFTFSYIVAIFKYSSIFTDLARIVDLDLLDLDHQSIFADPPVRVFIMGMIIVASTVPALALGFEGVTVLVYFSLTLIVVSFLILIGALIYPVTIIHDRIRTLKTNELSLINAIYLGDSSAQQYLRITQVELGYKPDLLIYEEKIRRIWTWPVASNIQRVVLFGLLPITTWVLAALVEMVVQALVS